MNKEIKEDLKKVSKLLEEMKSQAISEFSNKISEAIKEPAIISIEKDYDGKADTRIEGERLALIITLAGLEQTMFEKLNVDKEEFDLIKEFIGTKEV